MEVPSTTWFSEALCTSLYKDSGSSTSPNSSCMTGLDDDASSANYISNNYTDLSHSCRNQISHDDSKKFNNNSGESLSDTNRNSDSDNATAGDKITDNNENNNYLMLQAKHRLTNNHAQEEYIDLDKLYQTQRTLLNNATPSGSSLNYQNHHHHLQHSINNPHHQNILAQQLSCLPKGIPRHNSEPLMRGHGHLQGHTHPQGHGFPAQIRVYPPQGRRLPPQGQVVPTQSQAVPTQGHTMPTQGQPLPPQGHPHHLHPPTSVSSSTSPTPLSHPLPHLNSDHNHRRNHMLQQHHHHHHLPPQLPAHQPTPVSVNNSHHTYSNNYPSVFNGDATPAVGSQHGRDGFGHSSTPSEPNDYSSYAQQQYSNYNEDPDSDSESEHQRDSEVQPVKKRPGRPRGSRRKKPEKLGRLWEFIRDLLLNSETCPSLICWDNYEEGMFRFVHSDKVAKLWGAKRDNPDMNYEKLSRAMRYYYKSKVLQPVFGRRLVYKFGPEAKGWKTENPNFRC